MTDGVTISTRSLVRAWRESEYSEFWVQLTTTHPDPAAFERGIVEPDESKWEDGVVPRLTGSAPKGFVALVEGAVDQEHLMTWAEGVAARLTAEGVTGTFGGVSSASLPRWVTATPAVPTAFITWSYGAAELTEDPTMAVPRWRLDDTATRTVAELCGRFARTGGPTIYLRQGVFWFLIDEPERIPDMLAAAIRSDGMQAAVMCADNPTTSARVATLNCAAQTVLQIIDGPTTLTAQIDDLIDAICAHPELVDHAFIRPAYRLNSTWHEVGVRQPLPRATEAEFRYNQHLTTTHVVDAHGVQVLTDAQLAGIRDLTNWNVRDLGHGRHLVTATHLDPWYHDELPDTTTLERARADFADILLSPEAISEHPPPWSR